MTDEPILLCEDRGAVRILTLNRPRQMNALSTALATQIVDAVDAAHEDDSVAVIILAGTQRAFSAGADIKEAASRGDETPEAARAREEIGRKSYDLGARTDKPMIAAVRGYVLGGGCNLAVTCDMIVAGENAVFGYPEVKVGLAATMVTPGIVHRIGPKVAFEMLTLGENITAEKALSLGMINRVVPDDSVLDEAMVLAEGLTKFESRIVRVTKQVFLDSTRLNLADSLDAAQGASARMKKS
ncbi:MAG: enoyl-CoA hydratase/isomerase family protein [Alphaproteobacteria bacterium]|nr:enoyl-CoA hydratase/isomerase family protein [Alphaproteobacteria bacterium]